MDISDLGVQVMASLDGYKREIIAEMTAKGWTAPDGWTDADTAALGMSSVPLSLIPEQGSSN